MSNTPIIDKYCDACGCTLSYCRTNPCGWRFINKPSSIIEPISKKGKEEEATRKKQQAEESRLVQEYFASQCTYCDRPNRECQSNPCHAENTFRKVHSMTSKQAVLQEYRAGCKQKTDSIKSLSERIKESKDKARQAVLSNTVTGRYVHTDFSSASQPKEVLTRSFSDTEKRVLWGLMYGAGPDTVVKTLGKSIPQTVDTDQWVLERVEDCIYALEKESVRTWAITSKKYKMSVHGAIDSKGAIKINIKRTKS